MLSRGTPYCHANGSGLGLHQNINQYNRHAQDKSVRQGKGSGCGLSVLSTFYTGLFLFLKKLVSRTKIYYYTAIKVMCVFMFLLPCSSLFSLCLLSSSHISLVASHSSFYATISYFFLLTFSRNGPHIPRESCHSLAATSLCNLFVLVIYILIIL